jgi:opacity protein-like surface antigen
MVNQTTLSTCRRAHSKGPEVRAYCVAGLIAALASMNLWCPSVIQAEWYVAGQAGLAIDGTLQDSNVTSPTLGGGVTSARVSDLDLMNSPLYGAKAGYFFQSRHWLGFESEVFRTQPHITQQTVIGGIPGRAFADTLPGTRVNLTTWALNIIIREPSLSESLQPYGGIGPALFFASASSGTSSSMIVSPGVNLIAGARYFLTPQWAVFGEFKYDLATVHFNSIKGDYSAQIFTFGVAFHLSPPAPPASKAQP